MMELWEACDEEDGKENFLAALNDNLAKKYQFGCSMKLWRTGAQNANVLVQIDVNNAEEV